VKAARNLFKLDESIRNYCGHLRDLAHGHKTTDAAPTERTRLAAAQADAIELKNARARAVHWSIPKPLRGNGRAYAERFVSGCFGFLNVPPLGFRI
jgi:hypothetical protein